MESDQLSEMFQMQYLLTSQIRDRKGHEISDDEREQLFFNTCGAIIHEAVECRDTTNWKPWKKPHKFNTADAKEELVDVLHFVIQASIYLRMGSDEMYRQFKRKHDINMERQRTGY